MIQLFDSKSHKVGSFKAFEAVMEYFNRLENHKPWDPNSLNDQEKWNFVYYPHRRLSALFGYVKSQFTEVEQEAYESECDLIEVYTGESQYPERYIVTADLDMESLVREWCFEYAYAHRYSVFEVVSNRWVDATEDTCSFEGSDCWVSLTPSPNSEAGVLNYFSKIKYAANLSREAFFR